MVVSVSIIVPIYNAEKSLPKCINSILRQSYPNIELILINDGSTDQSEEICRQYKAKDNRIKVIHQQNSGPSTARNNGIKAASGMYLQFVDADDFIDRKMTEQLVTAMNQNSDLAICGYKSMSTRDKYEKENILPLIAGRLDQTSFLKHFGQLYQTIIIPSIWNKLYKKELILDHQIQFIDNVNMGEDLLFNLAYFKKCQYICVIQEPLYHYVTNNLASLSQAFNPNFIQNQEILYLETKRFLVEQKSDSEENIKRLNLIYAVSISNGLNNLFHHNNALSAKDKRRRITKVLNNETTKGLVPFFTGNRQLQLIQFLIKHQAVNSIYLFFTLKWFVLQNMYPLFKVAKRINQKD